MSDPTLRPEMLFSIIIPCFNSANYLAETLDSVLAQTHSDWECIIVNDGSTDRTEHIARAWAERDRRFTLLNKENGGVSSARNYGIARSKGDYLLFLDSDDVIYREYLAKATEALSRTRPEVLLCGSNLFEAANLANRGEAAVNVTQSSFLRQLSKDSLAPLHSYLVARNLVQQVGCFDETLPSSEDWDLWARIGRVTTSFATLNYTGAGYRMRPHSLSRNAKVMLETSIEVAQRIRQRDPRLPASQKISSEPIEPVIVHYVMKHCGDLLLSGRAQQAEELFEATVAKYRLSIQPQDSGGLISYLAFHDDPTPEAKRVFWSKHVDAISLFLLACEKALRKPGFYAASMTYLTAMWLRPDEMVDIIPFIRTKHLLRGAARTVAAKALQRLQISLGVLHSKQ